MNAQSVKKGQKSPKGEKTKKFKYGTKVVFIQGAFDLINWGHIKAFKKAKSLGDFLIVGLNSNELIRQYKKRDAVLPWYQKKFIIESCKYVDKVIKMNDFSPIKVLKQYDVDVYVLTKEWKNTKTEEINYMESKGGKVSWSPRFKGVVCTSDIKKILLNEAKDGLI